MISKSNQKGFTIVELMIATAVFSVVLLLCTYGLLEIGRTYYKGVVTTRTQETARVILDDAAEAIKFNGGSVFRNETGGMHCIGIKRFSFVMNRQLTTTNHGLVSDLPAGGCTGGTASQNIDGALAPGSRELLNTRTRLSRFTIDDLGNNLYRVTVRVVSGENDLLVDRNSDNNITTADNPIECKNVRVGSQFCAVSELVTTVQKRV